MNMKHLLLALLLCACAENKPAEPKEDPRLTDLRVKFVEMKAEAETLRDPITGWLTPTDCDGMLWTGKYAAVSGVTGVNLTAAEVEPGRFVRRPAPYCTSENPLWSDWSRDMFAGLNAYAWRNRDLAALERHLSFGRIHNWIMGRPFGDGRSVYLPATYGRLYQTIFALGGADDAKRLWPDTYPEGLDDYKAHLQMMNIWLRGEIEEKLREGDARPRSSVEDDAGGTGDKVQGLLDVTDKQLGRIEEHAAREPQNPFFQCLKGIYSGDFGPAFDALLDPAMPVGTYVRCDEFRRCQLAEWLFAADCVLRRY